MELSNPNYIGPGIWYMLHFLARNVKTIRDEEYLTEIVENLCENFPCKKCKEHFKTYLQAFPIKESIGVKVKVGEELLNLGLFMWTFNFHNSVNERIGKKILTFEAALELYSNKICSKFCENSR